MFRLFLFIGVVGLPTYHHDSMISIRLSICLSGYPIHSGAKAYPTRLTEPAQRIARVGLQFAIVVGLLNAYDTEMVSVFGS